MSIIDILVLGLVQGVTEFIPVSSSGHLVITSRLLGFGNAFTFDVLLNFGTLLALVIFYREKIWDIAKRFVSGREWPLVFKVIIATIPAVLIGLLFDEQIQTLNQNILIVVGTLIAVGLLMVFFGNQNATADDRAIEKSVGWKASAKIGLAQALALIPGTSRSGITILSGMRLNLSGAKASEFSFLIAIPIILGASAKTLFSSEGLAFVEHNLVAFVLGNVMSFVAGMIAISFLIKLISKKGLKYFGWYRIALGITLLILISTNVI